MTAYNDLTLYLDSGWDGWTAIGYYVHEGWVYLDGLITSDTWGGTGAPMTRSILLALPPEIRPASAQHYTLPVDLPTTEYTRDPALILPLSYDVTLGTDGTLTLDADPPSQVNTTPPITDYWWLNNRTERARYSYPMSLGLLLGAISWPLPDTSAPEDLSGLDWQPLAPYLETDNVEDIDSAYAVHNERVHLQGSVQVIVNRGYPEINLLSSTPPDARAGIQGDWDATVATRESDGQPFGLVVHPYSGGYVEIRQDELNSAGGVRAIPYTPEQMNAVSGSYAFEQNWIGPQDVDISTLTDYELAYGDHVGRWGYVPTVSVDYSTGICGSSGYNLGGPLPSMPPRNLDELLASIQPQPDWFRLIVYYAAGVNQNAEACTGGVISELSAHLTALSVVSSTLGTLSSLVLASDGVTPVTDISTGVDAIVLPPTAEYVGDPEVSGYGPMGPINGAMLWKWGQITGTIGINVTAVVNRASPLGYVAVQPIYDRRGVSLVTGDVLVLDGAGWPAVPPAPPPPVSSIGVGDQNTGLIRLGRLVG